MITVHLFLPYLGLNNFTLFAKEALAGKETGKAEALAI